MHDVVAGLLQVIRERLSSEIRVQADHAHDRLAAGLLFAKNTVQLVGDRRQPAEFEEGFRNSEANTSPRRMQCFRRMRQPSRGDRRIAIPAYKVVLPVM